MKTKSKRILVYLTVLIFSSCILSVNTSAQTVQKGITTVITTSSNSITNKSIVYPNAQIIGWRYKSENGKVYRRQYNYSREEWIGVWELC